MRIREAVAADAPIILSLIKELAEYEKAPNEVIATVADINDSLFCESPRVFCHLVEIESDEQVPDVDGDSAVGGQRRGTEIAGMAIWFLNYSTWHAKHGIYLEDLFVREQFRGRGYGLALLKFLADLCVKRGYTRFQWWVLDWNTPAIEFYKSQGAVPMSEWTVYRVFGEALRNLAK